MTVSLEQPGEKLSDERIAQHANGPGGHPDWVFNELRSMAQEIQALRSPPAEMEAVAWMHPTAGWAHERREQIAMHCRKDGPGPIPLFASPAHLQGESVKPLEWVKVKDNQWQAVTPFGRFSVVAQPCFGKAWRTFSPTGWATYVHDDPEELKRVTNHEYCKRIRSALMTPSSSGEQP